MGSSLADTSMNVSPRRLRLLRLYEIDRQVLTGSHPNATDLAAVLGVHPRTVQRDIEFLRDELGAPIEYDPLRRGWRYTEPDFSLQSMELPAVEREALDAVQRTLARLVASSLGEDVEALFEKLEKLSDAARTERSEAKGGDAKPFTARDPSFAAVDEAQVAEVTLLFRGAAASNIAGRTWHQRQRLEFLSDGRVRLRMTVPLTETLERWVLGWADEVIVEEPAELAAVIAGRQRRALRRQDRARHGSSADRADHASTRDQVALDFEAGSPFDEEPAAPRRPTKKDEEPYQPDFGFKGRQTKRKRRSKR